MQTKKMPRRLIVPLFASIVSVAGLNAFSNEVFAAPVQAKSADSFVDSIGVGTHLTYGETPYARFDDLIKPKLQELGIRHIRDGGHNEPDYLNKIKALTAIGIKSQLIFQGDPTDEVLAVLKKANGAVDAAEGPNESDLDQNNFAYKGEKFPSGTRNYQKELHSATKSDPATKNLPLVLPSVGWGENAKKAGQMGDLGDYCNLHSYPASGNKPTHDIDSYFIPHAKNMCGDKPLMVTETGYNNAVNDPEDGSGISELASSKYIPRMLLENFNRKIKRTFLYELINESIGSDREANFGLLRYDGSAKPAYTAIKNMISLFKDKQSDFKPGSLDYTLDGSSTDIHSTLLQKSDGTFFLILWQDADSWDTESKKDVAHPTKNVAVSLKNPASKLELFDPTKPTSASKTVPNGKTINIPVPDYPLILRIGTQAQKSASSTSSNAEVSNQPRTEAQSSSTDKKPPLSLQQQEQSPGTTSKQTNPEEVESELESGDSNPNQPEEPEQSDSEPNLPEETGN